MGWFRLIFNTELSFTSTEFLLLAAPITDKIRMDKKQNRKRPKTVARLYLKKVFM
jgi:hypothetical protein